MGREYRTAKTVALPIGLMVAIFLLSSIPGRSSESGLSFLTEIDPQLQNLLHIPLVGMLQVLWLCAFTKLGRSGWNRTLTSLSISLLYSFFDEFHQMFVPGRFASLQDLLLNFTGIVLGTFMFLVWHKINIHESVV